MPAGHLASLFNAQGPNVNCLTACAASSQAVGEAVEIIRRGEADVMLAGGTHTMIHPFGVTGFNLLTALEHPQRRARPGLASLRSRPRRIRVGRRGRHGDSRIARTRPGPRRPHPRRDRRLRLDGRRLPHHRHASRRARRAISCIQMALQDAGLGLDDVDYINAHGTSTTVNDKVETLAIKKVFGDRAYKIPVSSTKSMMGHLIAAAGRHGVDHLSDGHSRQRGSADDELRDARSRVRSRLHPERRPRAPFDYALSNSFGFGGQNIALIVRRL